MSNDAIETGWAGGRAWWRRGALAAALGLGALGTAGCEATFHPAPITWDTGPVTRAEVVPTDIWSHPHVWYEGQWVYLVNGRWYTPSPNGWVIFRREPAELYRQRTILGQRRFQRTPGYAYPPPERPPAPPPYPAYPSYPEQEPPRWRQQ